VISAGGGCGQGAACLSYDDAAGFIAGELSPEEHRGIADHLDVCDHCRRLISALAAAEGTTQSESARRASAAGLCAGQRLGRFSLTRLLGHGSMGEVWAAHDHELDRGVALKLLRLGPDALGAESTARLRREAQAMARLNHPNVVAIYELGTDDVGRVFCAMELVDGMTLRRWLATSRSWRAVLRVASEVARGIAAAHAVGLIHRDIKPENILVSSSGRTLVSDFGLAKLLDLGAGDGTAREAGSSIAASTPVGALTATGTLIGTPVYMAPEQLDAQPVDARSDQFSYCVTVYEALFGARPFVGDTIEELVRNARRGPARPHRLRGVPKGVVRCLERGLAADPVARWPSMTALIAELERAALWPRRRRLAVLAAGLGAVAIAGGLWLVREPDRVEVAAAASARRIAAVWNPVTAAVLQVRFLVTGAPLASERAATTIRLLDDYSTAWMTQRLDAWTATNVLREQTPEVLDRRLACFDQLAAAMDGLVALLLVPGVRDVELAPQSVYRLGPVATCSNLARLLARPSAPTTPAGLPAEQRLRELEALETAGRDAEALERAGSLVEPALRLGEPAIVARARFDLGLAQAKGGQLVGAESTLRIALQEAAGVRDHHQVAECWLELLNLVRFQLLRQDGAGDLESAARTAVAQAGDEPLQLAALAKMLALSAVARGDLATAVAKFTEARDRRASALGANHPLVAADELNLGAALTDLDRRDDAIAHLERAIAIVQGTLGARHPIIAHAEHNLGSLALDADDWRAADRHARAAIAMNVVVLGPDHRDVAKSRILLAAALSKQRARAILARALPATHPSNVTFDTYLAQLEADEGHWDLAVRAAREVVDAMRNAEVPSNVRAYSVAQLARMVAHSAPRDALPLYDEALRLYTAQDVRSRHDDIEMLRQVAGAALQAHRPAAALVWFDRMPEAALQLAALRGQLDRAR